MTRYQQGYYLFDNDINVLIENLKGNGRIIGLHAIQGATGSIEVLVGTGSAIVDGAQEDFTDVTTMSYSPQGSPFKSLIYISPGGSMMESSSAPAAATPVGAVGKASATPAPPTLPLSCLPIAEVWVPNTATSSTDLIIFNYDTIPNNGVVGP